MKTIGLKLETEPAPEDVSYLAERLYDDNVEHGSRQWPVAGYFLAR
jgi:hypothetical protein